MPDIVSRIRVEAEGADQAAREIRKLKEAYDQVSESARGISSTVGRADPFSQAVAAGGGAHAAGASPADVTAREERSRMYREGVREREGANLQYSALMRPQLVQQGMGAAEAMGGGRTGSAIGGALNMVGGLTGMAPLLAVGAAAFGVQRLADSAYERFGQFRHSGMSQRLGIGAMQGVIESTELERSGIPPQMVSSFFTAASQSGVNLRSGNAMDQARIGMVAAAALGIDPSAVAGLMGSLERAGIESGSVLGARGGMYAVAEGAFGRADAGMFIQGLQGMVDSMAGRGISVGAGEIQAQARQMAILAQAGMSPQAALSFSQQLQGRAIQAAGLHSPEDIIAFQAMRESGMSVTDTLIAMEESPRTVNERVLQYLRRASGDDEDLLRFRVRQYLGGDVSWSAVDTFLRGGDLTLGQAGIGRDIVQEALESDEYREGALIDAAMNRQLLSGISIKALEALVNLGNAILGVDLDPGLGLSPGDRRTIPTLSPYEKATEELRDVEDMTVQSVGSLFLLTENMSDEQAAYWRNKWSRDWYLGMGTSTVADIQNNREKLDMVAKWAYATGDPDAIAILESIKTESALEARTFGDWHATTSTLVDGTIDATHRSHGRRTGIFGLFGDYEHPDAMDAIRRFQEKFHDELMSLTVGTPGQIDAEEAMSLLRRMADSLEGKGFVFTDSGLEYRGVPE